MALRFYGGQNAGDYSEWTDTTGGSGLRFHLAVAAGLGGTAWGLLQDNTGILRLQYHITSWSGDVFRYGFRINTSAFTIGAAAHILCGVTTDGASLNYISRTHLLDTGSGVSLLISAWNDSGSQQSFNSGPIPSGDNTVEVRVLRATGASDNNGSIQAWVNGASVGSLTGRDIYNRWPSGADTRFLFEADGGAAGGTYYIDEFYVRDDDGEIFPNARFYQGAGSLSEKFTMPFGQVAPGNMTLNRTLGTVVIGSNVAAGNMVVYSDNPYVTGTATDDGLPTGTSITSTKWV